MIDKSGLGGMDSPYTLTEINRDANKRSFEDLFFIDNELNRNPDRMSADQTLLK